jgi:hypothetical protein
MESATVLLVFGGMESNAYLVMIFAKIVNKELLILLWVNSVEDLPVSHVLMDMIALMIQMTPAILRTVELIVEECVLWLHIVEDSQSIINIALLDTFAKEIR